MKGERLFDSLVSLWQKAPYRLRRRLAYSALSQPLRRLVRLFYPERIRVFELAEPLAGHRMRLDWHTQKAFVFGTYEPEVTQTIERVTQPGWVALDIGAHIGYYTLLLAKCVGPAGKVIAFEPLRENFEVLRENIELNNCQNVVLENKAASDHTGIVSLVRRDTDPFSSTAAIDSAPGVEVEAVRVDDYLTHFPTQIHLVKMDVEGAELAVLNGMTEVLRRSRPVVILEVHGFDHFGENHPALQKLKSLGYSLLYLDPPGPQRHVLGASEAE